MFKAGSKIGVAVLAVAVVAGSSTFAADDRLAPPLVKQINNGNWLDSKEAEALRDELTYQRTVHAYMTMLPALNVIGMRDGSEATFGKGYNVLPMASIVLPHPAVPLMGVGRPAGSPPPVISSRPRMPVGTLASLAGVSVTMSGPLGRACGAGPTRASARLRGIWPTVSGDIYVATSDELIDS
jgi:hypothetical protein